MMHAMTIRKQSNSARWIVCPGFSEKSDINVYVDEDFYLQRPWQYSKESRAEGLVFLSWGSLIWHYRSR